MKTFQTYLDEYANTLGTYATGGASTGPGMGQYVPTADLNAKKNPRIPRKKGQPAGSDKHSDLYTDENPKGTIHGLKFATVQDAKASVKKIEGSGKKHAHKIQAAIAMEQRAKEMGKTAEAGVYRAYIEKMKKKTKEMQKESEVDDARERKKRALQGFNQQIQNAKRIDSRNKEREKDKKERDKEREQQTKEREKQSKDRSSNATTQS